MKRTLYLLIGTFLMFTSCKQENKESVTGSLSAIKPASKSQKAPGKDATIKKQSAQNATSDHMNTGGMQWLTIEEAEKLGNKDGKKYLVDVYTDWCGWCKVMDKKTFSDPETQKFLQENFHVIKFNAEQKEPITFQGKTYEWEPSGRKGINRLANELLGSRLSYPTIVYLDENMKKIKSSPGFKDPVKLMAEMKTL